MGPSSAGALGPMQFLPSTWAEWGITAFGETGAPNIMDPFDAVPSAARLLCAAGAGSGGAGLRGAIFAYNHATWYVNEVLALAGSTPRLRVTVLARGATPRSLPIAVRAERLLGARPGLAGPVSPAASCDHAAWLDGCYAGL